MRATPLVALVSHSFSCYASSYPVSAITPRSWLLGSSGTTYYVEFNQLVNSIRQRLINVTEGDYDRAGQDVRRDEQAVENAPGDAVRDVDNAGRRADQDVKDIPSNIGSAVEGAASWIGDKFGGVENEGRRAEGDAQQFDQNVDNSYNQGENQGRQQGF